jgi:hypothetical protein
MRRRVHILSIILIYSVFFFSKNAEAITYWCVTGQSPGSVTGNVNYGTSVNWANPNRSLLSDDLYSRTSMSTGDISKYLEDKDFHFSIPSDATVTGVAVFIERYADAGSDIHDNSIRLEINGSVVGTDHGTGNARWSSTEGIYQYGGSADTWGLSLTPSDINSSSFGVLTSAYIPSGGSSTVYFANIDNVAVTIYFQTPGTSCGIYNLPVTMAGFNAEVTEDSKVKLNWQTYSEINNDYFTVQRSADGIHYHPIAVVKGKGNSTELNFYETIDNAPLQGISYYRLKQTDYDGKETIEEKIVKVTLSKGRDSPFSIYPNPSDGKSFQYYFSNPASEECRIIVQDFSGKEVYFQKMNPDKDGMETLQFQEQLKPGVYTIFTMGASQTFRERLLIRN